MPLQFRRGTDSDRLSITPAIGEPIYTTDTKALFLGDGTTVGGLQVSGGTDSASVIGLITGTVDSAYVQARQTAQDFAYSSLTGTPNILDSADVTSIVGISSTDDVTEGSSNLYYVKSRVDSDITSTVTKSFVDALLPEADTLDGQHGSYYLNYSNFTNTPVNLSDFTNDINLANKVYVDSNISVAIANLVDTAPTTLDTLNELAAALGNDANFATTVTNSIATKLAAADFDATFDSALSTKTTDNVTEGSTNLYYTDTRVTTLVDSAYVQARQLAQDFAYASLTGAPNVLDSADVTALIEANSANVVVSGTAPASPAEGDLWYDNVTTGQLYTYVGTSWLSTAGLTTLEFSSVGDLSDVDITTTAPANGEALVWDSANSKFVPGVTFSQADFDSAFNGKTTDDVTEGSTNLYYTDARVTTLVDSAYVQTRQTPQDFAYASLTGAPTNVSSFTNDAGYITAANALDSSEAQALIDASINALVDAAPAALDTLNELAAALGDDANFATTVTNAIAALPDSAEVVGLVTSTVDSAYVQARQTPQDFAYSSLTGAPTNVSSFTNDAGYTTYDSASTIGLVDSAYVQARQTAQDFAYSSLTGTPNVLDSADVTALIEANSANVVVSGTAPSSPAEGDLWYDNVTTGQLYTYVGTSWLSTAGLTTLEFSSIADLSDVDSAAPTNGQYLAWDSAASKYVPTTLDAGTDSATVSGIITSTVDSTYVQARQDFAYSSLTGAPTAVSSFTNDANYIATNDSAILSALSTTGNLIVGGNLQVNGTTVTVNSTNLDVTDNMIYLNAGESAGSPTASIDVGWAANVNDDGSYAHVGFFRDATDNTFKVYQGYSPEPDAAVQIDTSHASFALAPFAASTLTGQYLGFDSDVTAAGLATQSYVTTTIDSAYVQARQTPQDFSYSSLTGAPTNVSSFTNDAGYLTTAGTDSATVISIINATVDSAYVNALVTPGATVSVSGTAPTSPTEGDLWYDNVTTGQLYTYVGTSWLSTAGLTTLEFSSIADLSDVDSTAPTTGQYLAWNGSKYVPTTLAAGTDSATVAAIVTGTVDSAYVQLRQTPQDFAYASLTGAPTNVSSFTNDAGYLTTAIDSAGVSAIVTSYGYTTFDSVAASGLITTAINNLVDAAPAALDTLNELAAALGDDANFATTVTNAIAALPDSAEVATIVTSYGYATQTYVDTAVAALPDSAQVATIVTSYGYTTYDSANFTGQLTAATGTSVQAYDANLTSFVGAFTLPTVDGTTGQVLVTNGSGTLSFVDQSGGGGGLDSAAVTALVDSDYVLSKIVPNATNPFDTTTFVATAGQTVFTVSHNVNGVSVYLNGLLLKVTDDYTANGSAITLTSGANLNDQLTVISFGSNITISTGGGGGGGGASASYAYSIIFGG